MRWCPNFTYPYCVYLHRDFENFADGSFAALHVKECHVSAHDRYGREGGRRMLLDRLEWHGAPGLELWPRVADGVPSDTPRQDPVC